jgi:hypothetical protein
MNTTLSTNFPLALTYDLFPINTEYGIIYAVVVLIGLYILIITEVSTSFSSPPLPFIQQFGVGYPCPKPLLVSIFYIPYVHINDSHIILNHFQSSLFWTSSPLFPLTFIFITTLTSFVSPHLITFPNHLSLTFILSTM